MRQKDFAAAERALDRITPVKERARNRFRCVHFLLETAEVHRARQMLEICLREEPLAIEAQLMKAGFAEEAGDLDSAERACRSALFVDRRCLMAHFHLGLVLKQKGNFAQARRSLLNMLELIREANPQSAVEFGQGICVGRLKEMATMMLARL